MQQICESPAIQEKQSSFHTFYVSDPTAPLDLQELQDFVGIIELSTLEKAHLVTKKLPLLGERQLFVRIAPLPGWVFGRGRRTLFGGRDRPGFRRGPRGPAPPWR